MPRWAVCWPCATATASNWLLPPAAPIARRIVVQTRPRCIVAVACERDLTSGIQDSYPLPVFGVLNQRPCGPCLDTLVPLGALEEAIRLFLGCSASSEPLHAGRRA